MNYPQELLSFLPNSNWWRDIWNFPPATSPDVSPVSSCGLKEAFSFPPNSNSDLPGWMDSWGLPQATISDAGPVSSCSLETIDALYDFTLPFPLDPTDTYDQTATYRTFDPPPIPPAQCPASFQQHTLIDDLLVIGLCQYQTHLLSDPTITPPNPTVAPPNPSPAAGLDDPSLYTPASHIWQRPTAYPAAAQEDAATWGAWPGLDSHHTTQTSRNNSAPPKRRVRSNKAPHHPYPISSPRKEGPGLDIERTVAHGAITPSGALEYGQGLTYSIQECPTTMTSHFPGATPDRDPAAPPVRFRFLQWDHSKIRKKKAKAKSPGILEEIKMRTSARPRPLQSHPPTSRPGATR